MLYGDKPMIRQGHVNGLLPSTLQWHQWAWHPPNPLTARQGGTGYPLKSSWSLYGRDCRQPLRRVPDPLVLPSHLERWELVCYPSLKTEARAGCWPKSVQLESQGAGGPSGPTNSSIATLSARLTYWLGGVIRWVSKCPLDVAHTRMAGMWDTSPRHGCASIPPTGKRKAQPGSTSPLPSATPC